MPKSIKSVGLFIRPELDEDSGATITNLINWLHRRKIEIFIDERRSKFLDTFLKLSSKKVQLANEKLLFKNSDLIFSLGGDGTLIHTVRHLPRNGPAVFGVNMGTLGFTTQFSRDNMFDFLEDTIKGKFNVISTNLFSVKISSNKSQKIIKNFVNDVVINRKDISRLIKLSVETEKEHIYNISGDGLVISTPLGSTAYNLAAGGPIIHPEASAYALTPICPHSLTHRPLILNNKIKLKINHLEKNDEALITIDGQEAFPLHGQSTIEISLRPSVKVKLVENPEKNYFETLKNKFTLGRK